MVTFFYGFMFIFCFKFVFYAFQGRPDLIPGVQIDVMTEKANENSDQGTPSWLVGPDVT